MFDHPIYGSQDFLERLHGNLRGWQASRARRHAMYTQQAAPTAPAATMQASAVSRAAPPATGPTDDLVLLCYQYEQGRPVPVYAHAADLAAATAQASAQPVVDGASRPEVTPHAAKTPTPTSAPQDPAPSSPAANAAPPDFSEKSIQASAPPRESTSTKQGPVLDLSPPTPPASIRASEEKAETIERIVAQHRADMEAMEARHTGVVQALVAQHRADMEAAEVRQAKAVVEALTQLRADMEAAEVRRTTAMEATLTGLRTEMETRHSEALAEIWQSLAELRVPQREPTIPQGGLEAGDAGTFGELREFLAEQSSIMKAEHDSTTGAIRDIAEMLAGLGENVSGLVMAIARPNTPAFPAPPRRAPMQGEDIQRAPRSLTATAPWSTPAMAPAATKITVPAPAAPAVQEVEPAAAAVAALSGQTLPAAPNTEVPAPTVDAPARPLTVVRDPEPRRATPPPPVHRAAQVAAQARASLTPLSASLESFFSQAPPVTASASPNPRQRRAEQEARELERLHGSIADDDDDMDTESEDSHG